MYSTEGKNWKRTVSPTTGKAFHKLVSQLISCKTATEIRYQDHIGTSTGGRRADNCEKLGRMRVIHWEAVWLPEGSVCQPGRIKPRFNYFFVSFKLFS